MNGQQQGWEPTRRGGVRRTRIVQTTDQSSNLVPSSADKDREAAEAPGQNATRIKWRRAVRIPHRVLTASFNEKLGLPQCPYVIRWRLETPFGSVRLHHWLSADDGRAFHDHPWWFWTLVIRGGYTDRSPGGDDHLRSGSVRFRPALHQHTVYPDGGGCWTVIITGRKSRPWGFWLDGKFTKANKWFARFGHHPCNS